MFEKTSLNLKKFISLLLILPYLICSLTGCGIEEWMAEKKKEKNIKEYDARIYNKTTELILPSFLEENKVRGAFYENPDYVEESEEYIAEYYQDKTSPKERTYTINNQETCDSIFIKDKIEVDFNKEVVYLHMFADVCAVREYYIVDILIENQKVTIYYKLTPSDISDASMPGQRCLIVIMKKTDSSEVEFVKIK